MEPITLLSSSQPPHVITQLICLIHFIILLWSTPYSDSFHIDITQQKSQLSSFSHSIPPCCNTSACIVTSLLVAQPNSSISGRRKKFFISGTAPRTVRCQPISYAVGSRCFSAKKRQPKRKADHLHNLLLKRYSAISHVLERWF